LRDFINKYFFFVLEVRNNLFYYSSIFIHMLIGSIKKSERAFKKIFHSVPLGDR